jgi:hypothetical protein
MNPDSRSARTVFPADAGPLANRTAQASLADHEIAAGATTQAASRQRGAGVCLFAAAAALAAAEGLAHPSIDGDDAASLLDAAAKHATSWTAWCLLLVISAVLFVPGVVALVGRVSDRGARLTLIGGALFTAGLVTMSGFAGVNALLVPLSGSGARPEILTAITAAENDPVIATVTLVTFIGFHLGLPLLLGGLRRAGIAPGWVFWAGTVGAIGAILLSNVSGVLERACFMLIAVAMVPLALSLLRQRRF